MENNNVFYTILGVSFVLVMIFILLWSSIILFVLIFNWHTTCRSISNLLIINSCIAFLFFVFTFSFQIPYLFHDNEQLTHDPYTIFCRIRGFLLLFSCVAKVYSYLIQAISRFFLNILHKYRNLVSYHTNGIMIIISWVLSLIISFSAFISPVSFQYESESRLCLLTTKVFHTSFALMIIAFVIPLIIIIILYSIILSNSTSSNHIQTDINKIRNNKRDVKVFRNILLLIIIVIMGGTPFLLSIIINKIASTPWPFYSISVLFISLSTTLETLTILLTNKEIKTILYAKIPFCRTRQTQTLPLVPVATVFANSIRTNINIAH